MSYSFLFCFLKNLFLFHKTVLILDQKPYLFIITLTYATASTYLFTHADAVNL
jgi:hypothetical protein